MNQINNDTKRNYYIRIDLPTDFSKESAENIREYVQNLLNELESQNKIKAQLVTVLSNVC